MKKTFLHIFLLICIAASTNVLAGGVYLEPSEFINQVFDNNPPKAKVLWLNKGIKSKITDILSHRYRGLRTRYWQQHKKTVWILEEIGKEKLITVGIVINKQKIEQVKVLVFRESRGWEVRHDFFTDQFKQLQLHNDSHLSQSIDNISGATLSVRAVKKLARIALLLDQTIQQPDTATEK